MKRSFTISFLLSALILAGLSAAAQKENALIRSGNRYYKQKQIDRSQQEYQKAVQESPGNPAANYNLGNAQFRKNSFEDAAKSYDVSIAHAPDNPSKENGLYNKGVAMIKQQKLQESIEAWKNALKLNSADEEARENLQKALMQLKQQQQKEQKDQKDKKEQKKEQKDQKKEQQQPNPQPSKLTKQKVEQYLKALQQKENEAQEKMNQNKVKAPTQPEKDW